MTPFVAACRALEALVSAATAAGDLAAVEALAGALKTVRDVGGWRVFGGEEAPSSPRPPRSSGAPMTAAERARAYRQRHANRHGAVTPAVTNSVTVRDGWRDEVRDASRLAGAPSPSLLSEEAGNKAAENEREEKESQAESTRASVGARGASRHASRAVTSRVTASVTDANGPEHPAGDLTPAAWAPEILETVRMSTGRTFADLPMVWAHFVAHLAAKGWPVTRAEWLKWCTNEVKRNATASKDGLQRPQNRGRPLQPVDPNAPWLRPVPPAEGEDYDGR